MPAAFLYVSSLEKTLHFGEQTTLLTGAIGEVLIAALCSMLPAEKVPMMAPPTTRGYTLPTISATDYEELVTVIKEINQSLGQEVLRTNSRERGAGEPLQAKILLGDKQVVRGVQLR